MQSLLAFPSSILCSAHLVNLYKSDRTIVRLFQFYHSSFHCSHVLNSNTWYIPSLLFSLIRHAVHVWPIRRVLSFLSNPLIIAVRMAPTTVPTSNELRTSFKSFWDKVDHQFVPSHQIRSYSTPTVRISELWCWTTMQRNWRRLIDMIFYRVFLVSRERMLSILELESGEILSSSIDTTSQVSTVLLGRRLRPTG